MERSVDDDQILVSAIFFEHVSAEILHVIGTIGCQNKFFKIKVRGDRHGIFFSTYTASLGEYFGQGISYLELYSCQENQP